MKSPWPPSSVRAGSAPPRTPSRRRRRRRPRRRSWRRPWRASGRWRNTRRSRLGFFWGKRRGKIRGKMVIFMIWVYLMKEIWGEIIDIEPTWGWYVGCIPVSQSVPWYIDQHLAHKWPSHVGKYCIHGSYGDGDGFLRNQPEIEWDCRQDWIGRAWLMHATAPLQLRCWSLTWSFTSTIILVKWIEDPTVVGFYSICFESL